MEGRWKYLATSSISYWWAVSPSWNSFFLWLLGRHPLLSFRLPGHSLASFAGQGSPIQSLNVRAPQVSSGLPNLNLDNLMNTHGSQCHLYTNIYIFNPTFLRVPDPYSQLLPDISLASWINMSKLNLSFLSFLPHFPPTLFLLQCSLTMNNALGNKTETWESFLMLPFPFFP